MSRIQVEVLVCTTFFVVAGSILLVAYRRSGTFSTGVVAAGATRPAVVVRGAAGGLDACSAEFLLKVGDGNMKFSEVLQGDEELGVGVSAVCGESAVDCSESCYGGAITDSCNQGFKRLIDVVGIPESLFIVL